LSASAQEPHKFCPRARMILTIGLELISSDTVALTELVKNSFDADPKFVLIRITGPVTDNAIRAGKGTIEVARRRRCSLWLEARPLAWRRGLT
jgi:hypothetical protein